MGDESQGLAQPLFLLALFVGCGSLSRRVAGLGTTWRRWGNKADIASS